MSGDAVRLLCDDVRLEVTSGNGDTRLLTQGLTLRLHEGELLPLVGPSGAGKSTLLRAVVRLHPLSGGHILLDGTPVGEIAPSRLRSRAVLLPQKPVFSPGTLRDILLEPFAFRSNDLSAPDEAGLASALEDVGLDDARLDDAVHTFSGGEQQRVALARVLLIRPSVLLLDEPTANLDGASSRAIVARVRQWVASDGRAAIWVAHEREVLDALGAEALRFTAEGLVGEGSQ